MPYFTTVNPLAQREQFQDTWIKHLKVLQMLFISWFLYIISHHNISYKANTLARKNGSCFLAVKLFTAIRLERILSSFLLFVYVAIALLFLQLLC